MIEMRGAPHERAGGIMSKERCLMTLRQYELNAYSSVVTAMRAEGDLNDIKKSILHQLRTLFCISKDRHKAEVRRAVCCEKLADIALHFNSGITSDVEWTKEGRQTIGAWMRPNPLSATMELADEVAKVAAQRNIALNNKRMTSISKLKPEQRSDKSSSMNDTAKAALNPMKCPSLKTKAITNLLFHEKNNVDDENSATSDSSVAKRVKVSSSPIPAEKVNWKSESSSDSYVYLPGGTVVQLAKSSETPSVLASSSGSEYDMSQMDKLGTIQLRRKRRKLSATNIPSDTSYKIKEIFKPCDVESRKQSSNSKKIASTSNNIHKQQESLKTSPVIAKSKRKGNERKNNAAKGKLPFSGSSVTENKSGVASLPEQKRINSTAKMNTFRTDSGSNTHSASSQKKSAVPNSDAARLPTSSRPIKSKTFSKNSTFKVAGGSNSSSLPLNEGSAKVTALTLSPYRPPGHQLLADKVLSSKGAIDDGYSGSYSEYSSETENALPYERTSKMDIFGIEDRSDDSDIDYPNPSSTHASCNSGTETLKSTFTAAAIHSNEVSRSNDTVCTTETVGKIDHQSLFEVPSSHSNDEKQSTVSSELRTISSSSSVSASHSLAVSKPSTILPGFTPNRQAFSLQSADSANVYNSLENAVISNSSRATNNTCKAPNIIKVQTTKQLTKSSSLLTIPTSVGAKVPSVIIPTTGSILSSSTSATKPNIIVVQRPVGMGAGATVMKTTQSTPKILKIPTTAVKQPTTTYIKSFTSIVKPSCEGSTANTLVAAGSSCRMQTSNSTAKVVAVPASGDKSLKPIITPASGGIQKIITTKRGSQLVLKTNPAVPHKKLITITSTSPLSPSPGSKTVVTDLSQSISRHRSASLSEISHNESFAVTGLKTLTLPSSALSNSKDTGREHSSPIVLHTDKKQPSKADITPSKGIIQKTNFVIKKNFS